MDKLRAFADPAFPVEFTTARQDQVLEVLVGETVTFTPAGTALFDIHAVTGLDAAIEHTDRGFTVTPAAGRHHFRITLVNEVDVDVTLVTCEPAVLELCGSRPVLRALCGEPRFDGSLASARTFNLAVFGAPLPAPLGAYPNT